MPPKRHSVEQIIAKLREMEKLTGQGMPIPMAAKKLLSGPPKTGPKRMWWRPINVRPVEGPAAKDEY